MAQRGDASRAQLSDVFGPLCLCDGCKLQPRCRDYNVYSRDSLLAWVNGFPMQCSEYEPLRWRGLEGVRP